MDECSNCDSAYSSDESPTLKSTLLRCDLCKKIHPERRVLPCEHWFCPPCLASVLPPGSLTLSCPNCAEQSIVPEQGLIALPTTYFYRNNSRYSMSMSTHNCDICQAAHDVRWRCVSCVENKNKFLCSGCTNLHKNQESEHIFEEFDDQENKQCSFAAAAATTTASECSTPRKLSLHVLCDKHPGSILMQYCADCAVPLCYKCLSETQEHLNHAVTFLKCSENGQGPFDTLPSHLKAKWLDMQKALDDFDELSDSLSKHSSEEAARIGESFNKLSKLLEQRKEILANHLKETTERKMRTISHRKSELQKSCADEFIATAAKSNNKVEFNESAFPNLAALRKTIGKSYAAPDDGPKDKHPEDFPKYIPLYEKTFENLIGQFGKISSCKNMAVQVEISGDGLKNCCINRKCSVFVTTKNSEGQLVNVETGTLEAYIASKFGKKVCSVQIKEGLVVGNYDLVYTLRQEGIFLLTVKLNEQSIAGSPFRIKCISESEYSADHCSVHSKQRSFVSSPSDNCSVHSRQISFISSPSDHCSVHSRQRSFLSSKSSTNTATTTTKSRAHSKSPSSTKRSSYPLIEDDLVSKLGHRGRGLGQFTNPQGVCCTRDGKLIVTDSNNQNVQIFTEEGECILKFGSPGRGPGNMQRPIGIASMPNGNILIADYDNKWINVFEESGKYLGRFGAGVLLGPKGIAVDNDNHVIVVDNKSSTIFVYDMHKFKLLKKFSNRGDKPEQLAGPHYIAVSSQNHLYITDFHHHCVKVYNCSGEHLFSFGTSGQGNGQFTAPTGIAIDHQQNVFVSDWGNSRIQVLDSHGSFNSFIQSGGSKLFGPQGMCITNSGHIAVADSGNHCVKLYRYMS